MTRKTAEELFNIYNETGPNPWKTFDGRDVPRFNATSDQVRAKWEAVARAQSDESLDVLIFMRKFGQVPLNDAGVEFMTPHHITMRKLKERFDFMLEELTEFIEAANKQDLAGVADALVDLVYVAKGTANLMNLPWDELWDDVQRANMEKVRGVGKRGNLVDCVKPDGWFAPKTDTILAEAGYEWKSGQPQWDDPEHSGPDPLPRASFDAHHRDCVDPVCQGGCR